MNQLKFTYKGTHGGRRLGAGRPNRSGLRAHVRRPQLDKKEPVHVTLKLKAGLPNLRGKDTFRCLRESVRIARKRGFSVVHFAILSNHVHLILETRAQKLGPIFQSLCISFAKRLNAKMNRKGSVFHDRYHMRVLKTPLEVRNAIAYVLTNYSKHSKTTGLKIDVFSSAYSFSNWKKLFSKQPDFYFSTWPEDVIENWHREILVPARSWLLTTGWERAKSQP